MKCKIFTVNNSFSSPRLKNIKLNAFANCPPRKKSEGLNFGTIIRTGWDIRQTLLVPLISINLYRINSWKFAWKSRGASTSDAAGKCLFSRWNFFPVGKGRNGWSLNAAVPYEFYGNKDSILNEVRCKSSVRATEYFIVPRHCAKVRQMECTRQQGSGKRYMMKQSKSRALVYETKRTGPGPVANFATLFAPNHASFCADFV